MITPVCN